MSLPDVFPSLRGKQWTITSPATLKYNCVAWAADRTQEWWWPSVDDDITWPEGVSREETLDTFRAAFATLGFADCSDAILEPGFEKIAIFANAAGNPRHAARQLTSGQWTSKLGELEDIEHELRDLEGDAYGTVVQLMKRPLAAP